MCVVVAVGVNVGVGVRVCVGESVCVVGRYREAGHHVSGVSRAECGY